MVIHDIKFNHAKTVCMYLPSKGNCTLKSPIISLNLQKLLFVPKGSFITQDNRRFPRSMCSQGERPGCGSHVKRVDTEMLSTHDVALRNVDGSLFHVQI